VVSWCENGVAKRLLNVIKIVELNHDFQEWNERRVRIALIVDEKRDEKTGQSPGRYRGGREHQGANYEGFD
jgi:hypothetical protein